MLFIWFANSETSLWFVYIQTCCCFSLRYICKLCQMGKRVETNNSILLMFHVYGRVHNIRQKQETRNLKAYQTFKLECTERQTFSRLGSQHFPNPWLLLVRKFFAQQYLGNSEVSFCFGCFLKYRTGRISKSKITDRMIWIYVQVSIGSYDKLTKTPNNIIKFLDVS